MSGAATYCARAAAGRRAAANGAVKRASQAGPRRGSSRLLRPLVRPLEAAGDGETRAVAQAFLK
ncbi:hypothetical protein AQ611_10295 [Burkholderia singularis]|nr:hypothetical protein AQ611_10295 [Burkholderia sp. Bp7605]